MTSNVVPLKSGRGGARPGAGRKPGSISRPNRAGWVYVVAEAETPTIVKFGVAESPRKRLSVLQTGTFRPLKLHAAFDAGAPDKARDLELALHKRFGPLHVRGEWFAVQCEAAVAALLEEAELLGLPNKQLGE